MDTIKECIILKENIKVLYDDLALKRSLKQDALNRD